MEASVYIEGTKWTIPSHITAKQWAAIAILPEDKKWFISQVTGMPMTELHGLTAIDVEQIYIVAQHVLKDLETDRKTPIDFEALTFGQWVDLDVLANEEPHTKIVEITSTLLDQDTSEWLLKDAWPHFKGYIEWRNDVYSQYKNLFGLDGEYAEAEGESIDITQGWYDAIMVLANSEFVEIDNVTKKPFRQALNFLAWKKDQAELQKEQLKNIQNK